MQLARLPARMTRRGTKPAAAGAFDMMQWLQRDMRLRHPTFPSPP